jgi:CBS domain-containing protein
MSATIKTASPEQTVAEVAGIMVENGISGLPVVDAHGKLVGMVSEGDLIHRSETGTEQPRSWWLNLFGSGEDRARAYLKVRGAQVRDVMTKDPVTIEPDSPLDKAANMMEEHRIKRLPVVEGGALKGIISRADLLRALAQKGVSESPTLADDRALRERILEDMDKAGLGAGSIINVVVEQGVVHLWGLIDGPTEIQAIEALARNIAGADKVKSNLGIRPAVIGAA